MTVFVLVDGRGSLSFLAPAGQLVASLKQKSLSTEGDFSMQRLFRMKANQSRSLSAVGRFSALAAICFLASGIGAVSANAQKISNVSVIASTVPANGDVNPYGLAVVPATIGSLTQGHLLVSNFNSSLNLQGTGTTIVDIAPNGATRLFAQINPATLPGPCPGGVGLTTALTVLQTGWVIVGSLPTTDGTSATAQAGCLLVLDSNGNVAETFYGSLINGPWDSAVLDSGSQASLFITNVLNGTLAGNGNIVDGGTVVRINLLTSTSQMPAIESMTVIGSGFPERTDPAALVIGPTGVGLGGSTLFVADTLNNRVAAISNALNRTNSAGTGQTITSSGSLNSPLGLTVTPEKTIFTVNGGDGRLVVTNLSGSQIFTKLLDNTGNPPGAGALFGLVYVPSTGLYFVDDVSNTLNLYQ
jgi:hypothetical protein